MSTWIEYQVACFRLSAADLGAKEDRYAVAIEAGPSNVTEKGPTGRERRVRDWEIGMLGTRNQVLRRALVVGASCECGCTQLRGGRTTPEAYYGRIKREIARARDAFERHVTLSATVEEGHPLIVKAEAAGYVLYPETRFGETRVKLIPNCQNLAGWAEYFRLIDPHLNDGSVSPFNLGQVFGLPKS